MPDQPKNNKKFLMIAGAGGLLLAVLYVATKSPGASGTSGSGDAGVTAANSVYTTLSEAIANAIATLRDEIETRLTGVETSLTGVQAEQEQQAALITSTTEDLETARAALSGVQAQLNQYAADIANLTSQVGTAGDAGQLAAANAAAEAAYARAETAWLTSVTVFGPTATVTNLNAARDRLLQTTVSGLNAGQKQQWTNWVNSFIADLRQRGRIQGGGLPLNDPNSLFLSGVMSGPVGWMTNQDFSYSRPVNSARSLDAVPVRVTQGLRH